MRSLLAILLLFGASALSAHPFDDRADMVADIIIREKDGWDELVLTVQYRYESAYASYNEAFLKLDVNRDGRITAAERDARFEKLAADIQQAVVLTIEDEPATIVPFENQFAFVNLNDSDASVDQPGGMPTEDLRIGYYFEFEIQPQSPWGRGAYPVSFHFASKRIMISDPRDQLRAWDDRGEMRKAVFSVRYDKTGENYDRMSFTWETETGVESTGQPRPEEPDEPDRPVEPDESTEPPQEDGARGREALIETDKERHDEDSLDSEIMAEFRKLRGGSAGLWLWLTVLGLMFVWGAGHALMPGHGKTLVAGYLIGTQGTRRDALFLGVVVTAAHTSGVYLLLGAAWAFRTFWPGVLDNPEKQLAEMITLAVGATIFLMGFVMVMKRAGGGRHHEHDIYGRHVHPGDDHHHGHDHPHAGHHHHHDHDHSHSHAHDEKGPEDSDILMEVPHDHDHGHHHHHEPAPGKLSRWEILRLGVLGGLLPCPSAFVIGLIALQQQWYTTGLFLVLAFSLGLGMVLSAIGLALVQTKSYLHERQKHTKSRFVRLLEAKLPMFGALVITLLGTLMVAFALIRLGLVDTATFTV